DEERRELVPLLRLVVDRAQALAHVGVAGLELEGALQRVLDALGVVQLLARRREAERVGDSGEVARELDELRERAGRAIPGAALLGGARDRLERPAMGGLPLEDLLVRRERARRVLEAALEDLAEAHLEGELRVGVAAIARAIDLAVEELGELF